jgi:superfamily II DNA/RNA helicase
MRRPGLSTLVLDEADLMLSMPGYEEDLQALAPLVQAPLAPSGTCHGGNAPGCPSAPCSDLKQKLCASTCCCRGRHSYDMESQACHCV